MKPIVNFYNVLVIANITQFRIFYQTVVKNRTVIFPKHYAQIDFFDRNIWTLSFQRSPL